MCISNVNIECTKKIICYTRHSRKKVKINKNHPKNFGHYFCCNNVMLNGKNWERKLKLYLYVSVLQRFLSSLSQGHGKWDKGGYLCRTA